MSAINNKEKSTSPKAVSAGKKVANDKGNRVQSVDRALSILEVLARHGGELSLAGICEEAGLNISTCHHLLKTLAARNYVATGASRGSYALGSQVLALAASVNLQADLPRRARPFIDELNQKTGEAVHLAVLQNDELVTLMKRDALHALRVDAGTTGKSRACHATATGKAILAWLPEADTRRILDIQGMKAFTDHTITDPEALVAELAQIRENGYSMDREEFQPYVVCIGAPIQGHDGSVVGSVSVSTPIVRANDEHLTLVRNAVMTTAQRLSASAEDETSDATE